MGEILAVAILLVFVIQVFGFYKIVSIIRQLNKLLMEIRLLFKSSGIYYDHKDSTVMQSCSCKHCIYRMSFINISDNYDSENFYYRCKKQNVEITLNDSCNNFERDFNIK